jgi:hypothetical protein
VGRASTSWQADLFNRLRAALDYAGRDRLVTRDCHYGRGRMGDKPYIVVDTRL